MGENYVLELRIKTPFGAPAQLVADGFEEVLRDVFDCFHRSGIDVGIETFLRTGAALPCQRRPKVSCLVVLQLTELVRAKEGKRSAIVRIPQEADRFKTVRFCRSPYSR